MSKKPRGSIHKVREFELEKINLVDEFDILQIVGEGWFGKILLVEHRASQTEMVLKAVPKPYVSLRDFYREFHYGLHLGIHRNIVTTYDVAFETAGFYVFTQEYAPLGDLTSNVSETGVGEVYSKRVAKQIGSALDYMHSKDIVHRDVKLDNVLIYRSDFTRVKLCDFGESFQAGTLVERRNEWLPYSPPEVLDIKPEGTYKADPSHDVWQFGIVIFVCLTGCLPWQKAASDDPRYVRYVTWSGTMMLALRRTPKLFKLLTSRAQRMFRRFLEPKTERRPKNLSDLTKFLDDRWLAKTAEKDMAEYETDELCPSMYSFHSSPDEKHRLLYTLADCGIETHVDRQAKKNRIKDWIESSIITEEDEEENDETNSVSPSSSLSREPVAGHISSIRANIEKTEKRDIKSTLKDAAQKHFDPRTGALQQGPSEMGVTTSAQHQRPTSPTMSNLSTFNNGDSLAGSLITLGSRQDLIASNMQMYNSDMDLNRLGEPQLYDFNSGALHKQSEVMLNTLATQPLQHSKAALYASSPAIDTASNATWQQPAAPNSNLYFKSVPAAKNNDKKMVTFTGLTNAFQSLAQISMPATAAANTNNSFTSYSSTSYAAQQMQNKQISSSLYFQPTDQNYSQVKDSAYGSAEVNDSTSRITLNDGSTGASGRVNSIYPSNGNINDNSTYNRSVQQKGPSSSSVRTQSSQQQRLYGRSNTSSLKDTAYDRVTITNGANKRR